MSDPYGTSDRRTPSGAWDHHAEGRDRWGDQFPEPHGRASWVDEPTGYQANGRAEQEDAYGRYEQEDPPGGYEQGNRRGRYERETPHGQYEREEQYGRYDDGDAYYPAGAATPRPTTPGEQWNGPEPEAPARHSARSPRLVMIGAAAAVVLVLVAAAAVFALHKDAKSTPAAPDRTTTTPVGKMPDAAYPSSAQPTTKPSPTASKSAAAKAAAKKTTPPKASGGGGVPAPPAGFTLTFGDSFDGAAGTGLGGKYRYDTGPGSKFGTGEIETMTGSTRNVFHDGDGHLVLKAIHQGGDPGSGWTSGRFETNSSSFGAAKGGKVRMQASIEQPDVSKANGAGYWPAFWMLGNGLRNGGTWPKIGEVDILEDVNGRSSVFGTLHCGTNPGGPCGESTGIGSGEKACGGCQSGFHTYAVEIDRSSSPEKIRWFLDGANYFTISQNRVDNATWSNAVDHPFFIIFDLAMGGGFPGAFGGGPNGATVSGGQMKIDYVAVYNSN